MRKLLKNARIYDGTGSEPYVSDILVEDDRIAKIAAKIEDQADEVIDLTGKSIASGFIDAHSHNDWFAIRTNPIPYFSPFIRQGITSFITGNCGISAIGFDKDNPYTDKLGGGIFGFRDTTGRYGMPDEYFKATDGNMPCNIAILAGHCSARAAAGGNNQPFVVEDTPKTLKIRSGCEGGGKGALIQDNKSATLGCKAGR